MTLWGKYVIVDETTFTMRKLFATIAALTLAVPALAEPITPEEHKTYHSLGCMLLRECTEGVMQIKTIEDLDKIITQDYGDQREEFKDLIAEFNRIGVGIFVADGKYFPPGHRGVYHTKGNNFFLNFSYSWDAATMLEVTRHEGWHAAQDCMAGSIHNSSIAIIHHPDVIPNEYNMRAEIAYGGNQSVIPWEREALYAGDTEYATVNALRACQQPDGAMWDVYPPTPMTGEWLVNNGYWDGVTK